MNFSYFRFREWRLLAVCAAIGLIFAAGRVLDPKSTANVNPEYRIRASYRAYLRHVGHWSYEAANQSPVAHHALERGCISLGALLLAAWMGRRDRRMLWAVASFLVGVLPVAFIPQRGLEAVVVPLIAIGALVGVVLDRVLWRPFGWAALAGILLMQGSPEARAGGWQVREVDRVIGEVLAATRDLCPRPTVGEHVVIESDPFEEMEWGDVFVFRLVWNEPELRVHRRSQVKAEELARARRLEWNGGRWREMVRKCGGSD